MMFLLDLKTLLLMTKFWKLAFSTISEILFEGVNSNGDCLDKTKVIQERVTKVGNKLVVFFCLFVSASFLDADRTLELISGSVPKRLEGLR